ncbi:Uncharacterised protein [Mycobacterium tuberculosis]|nr:Uncharacterised protein [Mycobacterium tuberculosis]
MRRVSPSRRIVTFESGSNSRVRIATSMLLSIRSKYRLAASTCTVTPG